VDFIFTCQGVKSLKTAIVICFALLSATVFAQNNGEPIGESHGTVNILFANRNGLVLVTDSMLTDTVTGKQDPNGKKLFKVDEKTVCSMAGFYSWPGALDMQDFAANFPNIMSSYIRHEQAANKPRELSFATKFAFLEDAFAFQLASNLNAYLAFNPQFRITGNPNLQPITLTLAGYDVDGSLKVGAVTLTPTREIDGVSLEPSPMHPSRGGPACESVGQTENTVTIDNRILTSRTIGKDLSCEIAGLPMVAEERLTHPDQYKNLPALSAYSVALKHKRTLSISQMKALALELEQETKEDEQRSGLNRVGGDPNKAVLTDGHVSEPPTAALVDAAVGQALPNAMLNNIITTCRNPDDVRTVLAFATSSSLAQASLHLTNCRQEIDGILFHDSSFIDSVLVYYGKGPVLFSHSNVVTGSTLMLGQFVPLNNPLVRDLVCSFPWKAVIRQDQIPVALPCN
jgi:hypothetical protein